MVFNIHDVVLLAPENFLLLAACAILLVDLFIKQPQRDVTHWLSIASLLVTIVLIAIDQDPAKSAFSGMYLHDGLAAVLKVFILATTAAMFVYARGYLRDRKLQVGEFYLLGLFAALGSMLLVSAGSLVMVYLGLELLTLSSYALVALNRDSSLSSEAAMKYFVLGALASGMLLYGMS